MTETSNWPHASVFWPESLSAPINRIILGPRAVALCFTQISSKPAATASWWAQSNMQSVLVSSRCECRSGYTRNGVWIRIQLDTWEFRCGSSRQRRQRQRWLPEYRSEGCVPLSRFVYHNLLHEWTIRTTAEYKKAFVCIRWFRSCLNATHKCKDKDA